MIVERAGPEIVVAAGGDVVLVIHPMGCPPAKLLAVARLVLGEAAIAELSRHVQTRSEVPHAVRLHSANSRPVGS